MSCSRTRIPHCTCCWHQEWNKINSTELSKTQYFHTNHRPYNWILNWYDVMKMVSITIPQKMRQMWINSPRSGFIMYQNKLEEEKSFTRNQWGDRRSRRRRRAGQDILCPRSARCSLSNGRPAASTTASDCVPCTIEEKEHWIQVIHRIDTLIG